MNTIDNNYIQNTPDFAKRTVQNLVIYSEAVKGVPDEQKYEVTQIINSLLGLLVFPKEILIPNDQQVKQRFSQFPNSTVKRIYANRQIVVNHVRQRTPQGNKKNVFFAMWRHMRNAIAHGKIKTEYSTSNPTGAARTIKKLRFTSIDTKHKVTTSFVLEINDIFNIIAHIAMTIDSTISRDEFVKIAKNLSTQEVPITLDC